MLLKEWWTNMTRDSICWNREPQGRRKTSQHKEDSTAVYCCAQTYDSNTDAPAMDKGMAHMIPKRTKDVVQNAIVLSLQRQTKSHLVVLQTARRLLLSRDRPRTGSQGWIPEARARREVGGGACLLCGVDSHVHIIYSSCSMQLIYPMATNLPGYWFMKG